MGDMDQAGTKSAIRLIATAGPVWRLAPFFLIHFRIDPVGPLRNAFAILSLERGRQRMVSYHCDGCGKALAQGELRYRVAIDVRAVYDQLEVGLLELVRDHRQEMLDLIEKLRDNSPEQIEETVYKMLKFDLCPACQRAYIADPIHFRIERDIAAPPFDVDTFLRSLGYGASHGPTDE